MATKKLTNDKRQPFVSYFRFDSVAFAMAGADLERVHAGIVDGRVPSAVLGVFRDLTGFTIEEMSTVIGISARTVSRKERDTGTLSTIEADRAIRFTRILHAAVDAIGELPRAVRWMRKPNAALQGHVPLELIASEPGAELVLAALDRIAFGGIV